MPMSRPVIGTMLCTVAAASLLFGYGIGSPTSAASGSTSEVPAPEPTTTVVPTPEPAPLFTLLAFHGDMDVYPSARHLIKATKATMVVSGTIEDVSVGGTTLSGPVGPGQGRIETAYLKVRPTASRGRLRPDAQGNIYVETFRDSLVTEEWLEQATDYRGRECVFVLANRRIGQSTPPGQVRETMALAHPQALFCPEATNPSIAAGQKGTVMKPVLTDGAPSPTDIGELAPTAAVTRLGSEVPAPAGS